MANAPYPYRDRSCDHLFPHGSDGDEAGLLMAQSLRTAKAKVLDSMTLAIWFPKGREHYEQKLDRLIESFTHDAA